MRIRRQHFFLTCIIFICVLFFFFRTHDLHTRLILNWDQENYSTQIKELVQNHKITLLGPRANNDKGFFLAPYFTYLMTPFYLISNLHPLGTGYFIIFYNMLFLIASFLILRRIFDWSFASFFVLLWATNNIMVGYDTIPWWPIVIPLGSLITLYGLYRVYNDRHTKKWYFLLGLILGFFLNHHFQFIFVCIFTGVFLLALSLKRRSVLWIQGGLLLLGFAIMLIPLFLFDLRHHFLNLSLFLGFFQPATTTALKDPNIWATVFRTTFSPLFFGALSQYPLVVYLSILGASVYLAIRRSSFFRLFYISLSIVLLSVFVAFRLYGQRPSEYYFIFLYPFVITTLLDLLRSLPYRWIALGLYTALYLVYTMPLAQHVPTADAFALYEKDRIIRRLVKEVDLTKLFNVSFDVPPNQDNGYRYLLSIYGVKQSGSPTDPLIEVRIPPHEGDIREGNIGLRIDKELRK